MRGSSSLAEPSERSGYTGRSPLSPSELAVLERRWVEKSDESLQEAARSLRDYTEVGQSVIREELRRRSMEVADPDWQNEGGVEFVEAASIPIYSNPDFHHVDALRGTLESEGIECEVRGSRSGPLSNRPWSELWIRDESQTAQAGRVIQAALDRTRHDEPEGTQAAESDRDGGIDPDLDAGEEPIDAFLLWTCPQCSEEVEGQFSVCWNCGCERPTGSVP